MKELSKLTILLFLSIFNILPVILSKTPHKCVVEVLRERRENVSGTEFCWTWGFSCPRLTEEIVRKTENVTMCCPGFLEDIDGNCQEIEEDIGFSGEELELEEEDDNSAGLNCIVDCNCSKEGCEDKNSRECNCRDNNLFYLIVILPLITLVILILVLVYFILKMKAKLRILREHRQNKVTQNNETKGNVKRTVKTQRGKTVSNPLYYDNSGFCTISEKNINKDSTVKVAIHKGIIIEFTISYIIYCIKFSTYFKISFQFRATRHLIKGRSLRCG